MNWNWPEELSIALIVGGMCFWIGYKIKHAPIWTGPPECGDCNRWKGNPCKDCPDFVRWREGKK